jgi:hypothetical protein
LFPLLFFPDFLLNDPEALSSSAVVGVLLPIAARLSLWEGEVMPIIEPSDWVNFWNIPVLDDGDSVDYGAVVLSMIVDSLLWELIISLAKLLIMGSEVISSLLFFPPGEISVDLSIVVGSMVTEGLVAPRLLAGAVVFFAAVFLVTAGEEGCFDVVVTFFWHLGSGETSTEVLLVDLIPRRRRRGGVILLEWFGG